MTTQKDVGVSKEDILQFRESAEEVFFEYFMKNPACFLDYVEIAHEENHSVFGVFLKKFLKSTRGELPSEIAEIPDSAFVSPKKIRGMKKDFVEFRRIFALSIRRGRLGTSQ